MNRQEKIEDLRQQINVWRRDEDKSKVRCTPGS